MPAEPQNYFSATWVYNSGAGTYTNNTLEAKSPAGTAFSLWAATGDYLYLGSTSRFDMAVFDLSIAGSVGTVTWEYYNGSTWVEFVPLFAELDGNEDETKYLFSEDGGEVFPVSLLTNWTPLTLTSTSPHTATVPDSISRHWVRIKTASITTTPTVFRIQKRDYNTYCTPSDVYNFLQLNFSANGFTEDTKPSLATVEDLIHRKQGIIDRMTRKSWRPNLSVDHQPFNLGGITLSNKPVYRVLKLEIWNGGSWENKTLGRDNDWFFIPRINTINFSRIFLLPARFTGANRGFYGFGIGEFDHGIRIKYLYGTNRFLDLAEGSMISDICIKMTAVDILMSADYSKLLVSGTNKISVEQKIADWRLEVAEGLEALRRFETF